MSNRSNQISSIMCARIAGVRQNGAQTKHGGRYYPAHINAGGKRVNARWEGRILLNSADRVDDNGAVIAGKVTGARLVIWNGNNATPGKGAADTAAKYLAVGKEISFLATMESYTDDYKRNGQPVLIDGQPIKIERHSLKLVGGSLLLGSDSDKQLAGEFQAYTANPGAFSFYSRPLGWNTTGHVDKTTWGTLQAQRSSSVCNPATGEYGYAMIGQVRGTVETPAVVATGVVTPQLATGAPAPNIMAQLAALTALVQSQAAVPVQAEAAVGAL